jgi:uncharacterized membrane protein YdjX (TVP38/TMEM64 family)
MLSRDSKVYIKKQLRLFCSATVLCLSAVFLIGMCVPNSFVQRGCLEFLRYVESLPTALGAVCLSTTYALFVTCMLPGTPFNLGAGFLYGLGLGAPVAICGGGFGALGAFLMGRFLVREWAEEKMRKDKRFRAIDRAIMRNGFNVVFLMRLSPVLPFPLLSYIFGVSKIHWMEYATATFLGILPATIIETYLGSELTGLTETFNHSQPTSYTWIIAITVATFVSLGFVSYISHQALRNAMHEANSELLLPVAGDASSPASPSSSASLSSSSTNAKAPENNGSSLSSSSKSDIGGADKLDVLSSPSTEQVMSGRVSIV